MSESQAPTEAVSEDFSIVLGGPLYQLYIKTRMARSGLDNLVRRLIGIPVIAWAPLAVLAVLGGHAFSGPGLPFLQDIEAHARFLVSIPLMIIAEVLAHRRISALVRQFVDRGLIAPEDMPRFEAIKASSMKLRNSVTAEVVQLILAFSFHWISGRGMLLEGTSWIGSAEGGEWHYSAAGFWYAFVSKPIFRLMLFRWYYRLFIWYRFLWKAGRLNLRFDALHPDRAGGIGFLSASPGVFTPLLLAHSALVAAFIQNRIWTTGAKLPDFKIEITCVLVLAMMIALTPLFFFMGALADAKRKGGAAYGALASRYVDGFRQKWLRAKADPVEPLVGSADIQSLADLSGAYDAVRETRLVPITRQAVVQLLIVTAIPLLPLLLNMIPFEELLQRFGGLLL